MTAFRPETDAFAFDNSWPVDDLELDEIRRYLAHERAGPVRALARSRLAHRLVRMVHEHHLIDDLMSHEDLTRYGLCGGMAFAALDYYRHGWVLPQGAGPDDHPAHEHAAGRALRNYIWQRLLDSMQGRAAGVMLRWSLALHLLPGVGERWVLARTRPEWAALKRHLDRGEPWPIGLVGHARGTFANHQVLALGYDDPGDGTGTIVVYDSCCPRSAHTIRLDFRGRSLLADESCSCGGGDARWQGFFCNAYRPARPPIAVGLSDALIVSPDAAPDRRDSLRLQFAARNDSFSQCPPLALRVGARSKGADETIDAGGEEMPQPLAPGATRRLVLAVRPAVAADGERYFARCSLGVIDGREVWKRIPAHEGGADSVVVEPQGGGE